MENKSFKFQILIVCLLMFLVINSSVAHADSIIGKNIFSGIKFNDYSSKKISVKWDFSLTNFLSHIPVINWFVKPDENTESAEASESTSSTADSSNSKDPIGESIGNGITIIGDDPSKNIETIQNKGSVTVDDLATYLKANNLGQHVDSNGDISQENVDKYLPDLLDSLGGDATSAIDRGRTYVSETSNSIFGGEWGEGLWTSGTGVAIDANIQSFSGGIATAKSMGALTDAIGLTNPTDTPWATSIVDLGNAIDPDQMAASKCSYPYDSSTPTNVLPFGNGGNAILFEARSTDFASFIPCANEDGEDNDTICEYFFHDDSDIACVEGLCSYKDNPYGGQAPVYESNMYSLELLFEGGTEFWNDDDDESKAIIFKLFSDDVQIDLNDDGVLDVNDTISINKGSSVSLINNERLIFFNQTSYSKACLVFSQTTSGLNDLLSEFSGEGGKFCTTFGPGSNLT